MQKKSEKRPKALEPSPWSAAGMQASLENKLAKEAQDFGIPGQAMDGLTASIILPDQEAVAKRSAKRFEIRTKY